MTQIDALKTDEIQNYEIEHQEEVRRLAGECMVILENDGVLPLQAGTKKIALFGTGARHTIKGGTGSGDVNVRENISIAQGLERAGFKFVTEGWLDQYDRLYADAQEAYAKKLNEFTEKTGKPSMLYAFETPFEEPEQPEITEADVKEADAAIYVISRNSGEGKDRRAEKGDYYLSDRELQNIRFMTEHYKNCIVLLNVGGVIDLTSLKAIEGVQAIMLVGQTGNMGGYAVADVLTAKTIPSGKLTDTWAKSYEDYPSSATFSHRDGNLDDEYYSDGIYVGYRYFDTFGVMPLYCFGYGKSYTEFEIKTMNVTADEKQVQVEVEVTNIGDKYPGKEVVQVYVGKPESELEQPEKELVFFEKTKELLPGEEQKIPVHVPVKVLTSYSEEKAAYILSKGYYRIYVGNSIEAAECGGFDEEETRIIKQVTNLLCCDCKFTRLSKTNPDDTWPTGAHSGVVKNKLTFLPYEKRKHYPAKFDMEKPEEKVTFDAVRKNPSRAAEFVAQMSPEELARISICASAGWGMEGIGEAGRVFQTEGYDLPDFPVSDGNSGVNLNIKNIGMPSGVTICASFNKELSEAIGCVIGEEAKALGMPLVLAPAFNIHRNPLNGRQPEYFSEDPYLSGVMAGFYAKGLEGAGIGSCYKHFIGNNCESSRKRNQSLISERAIREIYFRTFEYAMDVHMPASFMTAYNAVNGCPTAADEELLQGLLREENGFAGFVMTDWTTYDSVDVAAMVQAGNCWITPGSNDDTYTGQIKKGLENGTIDMARLQENVTALIRTMAKFS